MKFLADEPIYECLLLHGLCEHEGRMYQMANFLRDQGCNVHVPTHLGHGERVFQSDKIKNIQDFYLNDERDLDLLKHSHCTKELEKKYQMSRERVSMYDHLSELKTDLKNIANHSDLPIFKILNVKKVLARRKPPFRWFLFNEIKHNRLSECSCWCLYIRF